MRKNKFLLIIGMFLLLFNFSCEKEESNLMPYTFSWLPITNFEGGAINAQYTSGDVVKLLLKLKSFDDNAVKSVNIYVAELNETTGNASTAEKILEYQASSFVYNEILKQHELKIEYSAEAKYEEKKVVLTAEIIAENGDMQTRTLAKLGIAEPVDYLINGVPYFYMYSNTSSTEKSAGYSCGVSIMHLYGGFTNNVGEIGGETGSGYTPDWVMDYYGATAAATVAGLDNAYNTDAWWYGTPKRIEGTSTAAFVDIENELMAGRPVIVHGDFRNQDFAHQIVLIGMGSTKFVAIDPAGKWDGVVHGNYTKNSTAGNYVSYTKAQVKAAIGNDGAISLHKVISAK